ncbi:hypothetical protein IB238_03545 [Rhizobium sp. ARZ01]|uniref:hypothetical protein n=1 Tax=Rhizobium sp. ARZ01 TaxID=2769313 RepID=UPI00178632E0|nr:hypothetical protein [Rhizobium sp. ARZ01]MBD9371716.1 hypothetical protein [Rhizobium sp. ARZ01]
MARTTDEWSALLGSALSKMALVYGSDSPDAYLPEDCYPVIEKMFEAAMQQARAEGYAAATRDMQFVTARSKDPSGGGMIRQMIRAVPMARRFA